MVGIGGAPPPYLMVIGPSLWAREVTVWFPQPHPCEKRFHTASMCFTFTTQREPEEPPSDSHSLTSDTTGGDAAGSLCLCDPGCRERPGGAADPSGPHRRPGRLSSW